MSFPSELASPLPTPVRAPSKRQFPNPNGPPPTAGPGGVATASQTSAAASYTASLVPVATTATLSSVNTRSLVFDPSVTTVVDSQSATPTNSTGASTDQSIIDKLFTPNGGLFTVGIIILSLAALALITCAIVTIRCTLRNRRRSRMRSRAQSFTEKNVARRPMSSDRVSEFWSAGANQSIRERTMSGDSAAGGIDSSRNGQYPPPPRPVRSGETEADLRAPGRIHFTPSVMMSDRTGLSMDVQHGSARTSGANMDTDLPNPLSTNSAVATTNSGIPEQSGRRGSAATYALDQDPFAASPIISMPPTVKPLTITRAKPSHNVYNSPHTLNNSSSQFAANFDSSPSNTTASPSETAALGSSFGSTNMLGLTSSPSSTPYVPANTTVPLEIPTSAARYESGRDTIMSDPFAYDNMMRSRAPTLGGASFAAPFPSPGVTWTNVNSGVASPPALHIARASPGIQTALPSPYLSPSPLLGSSATPPAIQVPLLSGSLQHDVTQALSEFQRRMSASTVATRFSQQTEYQYRAPLGTVSDEERSFGYFMHGSPGGPKRSLPFVPRLNGSAPQAPESLQMLPTRTHSRAPEYGSPVYSSTTSVFDTYYQVPENSRSRSGTRS
ncbi:unnamed protein product [Rhizoctonia solani]|nr:unnamed protein product [Rhizoctonia solani]